MLREVDLSPPPCGLRWGMSPGECVAALATSALRQDAHGIEVHLPLGGEVYEARLWTDAQRGLREIQVVLRVSADSSREHGNTDGVEAARADYEEWYRRYIVEISGVLGAPDGSSQPDSDGPLYEVGGGLTYWERPTGRVELAFYHEGKHAPFELYLTYSSDTFPL